MAVAVKPKRVGQVDDAEQRNEEQRGADMARVAREARAAREAAQGQARAAREEEEEAGPSRGRRPRGRPPANGARAGGNSGKGQKL